jgi:response regulator of citrate/malate metabolism
MNIKVNTNSVYTTITRDSRINKPTYNLYLMFEANKSRSFTKSQVAELMGYARTSATRYLNKLLACGYISKTDGTLYRFFSGNGRETLI